VAEQRFSVKRGRVDSLSAVDGRAVDLYSIVLFNDEEHSFFYVIQVLGAVFGYPWEDAFMLANAVDKSGQAVVFLTDRKDAEQKRQEILSYGADPTVAHSTGPLQVAIRLAVCP
jgi:ATP-dependent Clp protease adaptor protein ClpS